MAEPDHHDRMADDGAPPPPVRTPPVGAWAVFQDGVWLFGFSAEKEEMLVAFPWDEEAAERWWHWYAERTGAST